MGEGCRIRGEAQRVKKRSNIPLAFLVCAAFFVPGRVACASEVERLLREQSGLQERQQALAEIPPPEQENAVGLYLGCKFSPETSRWIQVDLGEVRDLDAVALVPAYVASKWGYGFPPQYRVEASLKEDFAESQMLWERSGFDHPIPKGPVFARTGGIRCRYLRVTATRLAVHPQDSRRALFCLGEIQAFSGGRNVALRCRVTAPGSAESLPTWSPGHVVDGSTAFGVPMRPDGIKGNNGWHSGIRAKAEDVQWVQVDLGESRIVDEVRLVPARPSDFLERAGFGFPVRFRVELSEDSAFEQSATVFDSGERDFIHPGGNAVSFLGMQKAGRYVRVTATRLWQRHEDFGFALAELEVFSGGRNVALGSPVTALDETQTASWKAEYLVDGRGSVGMLVNEEKGMAEWAERAAVEESLVRVEEELLRAQGTAAAARRRGWGFGAGAVGVLACGWIWRERRIRRREERRLREQIARDLHDEIGSTLGSIALMSERAARKGDRDAMVEIGQLAVDASASMRGILWMVRGSGALTLGELQEALRRTAALLLEGREWVWEGTVEEVDARRTLPFHRDVFLLFKEALHNVVRHSKATRVELGYRVGRGVLKVEVWDNGCGFDSSVDYAGSGLVNMRHRASQLGGMFRVESGSGRGTRIQLEVRFS